jgi:hypothetical protein
MTAELITILPLIERPTTPVWIKLEIVRLELVAAQEVELDLVADEPLGIEDYGHPLAAGRLSAL